MRVSHGRRRNAPHGRSSVDILTWLRAKYEEEVDFNKRSPIELPNAGRDTLARWFYVWGFTRGAEIGVERGMYSEVLCRANPNLSLYGIDSWAPYSHYRDHVSAPKLEGFYQEAAQRLAPYHATLLRKFSVDAARDFKDGELDFVYLDGNHALEHVIADLAAWTPKIRPGGIIAGHDYSRYKLPNQIHVVQAVTAWTSAKEISPWFLLGSQAKDETHPRDAARSWCWVQPEPVRVSIRRPIKQ